MIPWLGARGEDVHSGPVPARVVHTAGLDNKDQGPVIFLGEYLRAAFSAETPLQEVTTIRLRGVVPGLALEEFKPGFGHDQDR